MEMSEKVPSPNPEELIPAVEQIARQAGHAVMELFDRAKVYAKADGSSVTDADLAAENIILPALQKITPQVPIISEERVADGNIPDFSAGTFWTVDPIDGTQEYIDRTDGFVVAIGLVSGNKPALGVVYHPSLDLLYSAAGSGTASKTDADGKRTPLTADTANAPAPRVLLQKKYAHLPQIRDYLAKRFKDRPIREDTETGIFRPCQIAEGLADLFVFCTAKPQGRIAFWDVAPGQAIIEAMGGHVETLDGQPFLYDASDCLVPAHIALSPLRAAQGF